MDRVALRGLKARGHHGVFPKEREEGQTFIVDLVLGLDTRPAAADDDLTKTVHYGIVAEEVVAVVEGEPVNLIETLAERIARTCLKHEGVEEVEVDGKDAAATAAAVEDGGLGTRAGHGPAVVAAAT